LEFPEALSLNGVAGFYFGMPFCGCQSLSVGGSAELIGVKRKAG